jgi:hypothetical membrane protein
MKAMIDEPVAQASSWRRPRPPRFLAAAGALLLVSGFIVLMGIVTAEALYPLNYSTSKNAISDLGSTAPPNSISLQPSVTIFNSAMIAAGLLALAAGFCLERGSRRILPAVFAGLTGLGMLGVGIFPSNYGNTHTIFAMLIFFAGGLAAIVSVRIQTPPFNVISVILGLITLVTIIMSIILGDGSPMAGLGLGGVERWIAYPIVAWVMSFGGYLMGRAR